MPPVDLSLRIIDTIFIGTLPRARRAPLQNDELKIASVAMNLAKQFVSPFILLSRQRLATCGLNSGFRANSMAGHPTNKDRVRNHGLSLVTPGL
jgi:hypothetical protein